MCFSGATSVLSMSDSTSVSVCAPCVLPCCCNCFFCCFCCFLSCRRWAYSSCFRLCLLPVRLPATPSSSVALLLLATDSISDVCCLSSLISLEIEGVGFSSGSSLPAVACAAGPAFRRTGDSGAEVVVHGTPPSAKGRPWLAGHSSPTVVEDLRTGIKIGRGQKNTRPVPTPQKIRK